MDDASAALLRALDDPRVFRGLVDALPTSPVKTCLQVWGMRQRLYPVVRLPHLTYPDTLELMRRVESSGHEQRA